jgi:hypothetical protein
VGPFARPAIWLAGAPHDRIASRGDKLMYGATGFLMLLVATVAGLLMATFVDTVTNRPHSTAGLVVGAVWAVVILAVDRSILTLRPYATTSRATAWSYVVRVGLALAIAVIVGETALLQIFQSEIKARATADSYQAAQVTRKAIEAGYKTRPQIEADAGVPTACSPAQRQQLQDTLAYDTQLQKDEQEGVLRPGLTTGEKGDSTRSRAMGDKIKLDLSRIESFDAGCQKASGAADTAWNQQQQRVRDAGDKAQRAQEGSTLSWTAQEAALDKVMSSSSTPLFARTLPWLLRVAMVLIDLLPLLAKLAMRNSLTESQMRAEAEFIHRRREIWQQAAVELAEYEAQAATTDRKERIDADRMHRQWLTWRGSSDEAPVLHPVVTARVIDVRDHALTPPAQTGPWHTGAGDPFAGRDAAGDEGRA